MPRFAAGSLPPPHPTARPVRPPSSAPVCTLILSLICGGVLFLLGFFWVDWRGWLLRYLSPGIVNFIGDDTDETGVPYAGVIPVEKALDPFGDAILAYEMNGETLPRDHGYPVRLLAPGYVAFPAPATTCLYICNRGRGMCLLCSACVCVSVWLVGWLAGCISLALMNALRSMLLRPPVVFLFWRSAFGATASQPRRLPQREVGQPDRAFGEAE